jgi:hypothetical protein
MVNEVLNQTSTCLSVVLISLGLDTRAIYEMSSSELGVMCTSVAVWVINGGGSGGELRVDK